MLIPSNSSYEALCAIWYYLHNLKHVKNTHGGVFSKVAGCSAKASYMI